MSEFFIAPEDMYYSLKHLLEHQNPFCKYTLPIPQADNIDKFITTKITEVNTDNN